MLAELKVKRKQALDVLLYRVNSYFIFAVTITLSHCSSSSYNNRAKLTLCVQ